MAASAEAAVVSTPGPKPPYQPAIRMAGKNCSYGAFEPSHGHRANRSASEANTSRQATTYRQMPLVTGACAGTVWLTPRRAFG